MQQNYHRCLINFIFAANNTFMAGLLNDANVKSQIIRNGILLAVLGFVLTQGVTLLTSQMDNQVAVWGIYLLMFLGVIFLDVYFPRKVVINARTAAGGQITFGNAFIISLTTLLLATLLQTIVYFILLLLFKDFYDNINITMVEKTIYYMQEHSAPQESIDQMVDSIDKIKDTTAMESVMDILLKSAIFSVIISLLIGAFIKKDKFNENGTIA